MKNLRTLSLAFALAASAALTVACSGAEPSPQTSASALAKAPIGQGTRGPVKLVGEALGEVSLRPEQRAELEKLAKEADVRHQGLAKTHQDLMRAVADQVESGRVDRAALQPKIDRAIADMKSVRPADGADLEKLHAILDPSQRDEFVTALEERMKDARKGHRAGFGKMKELADAMSLTDEQRGQIKDVMRAAHAGKADRHEEAAPDGQAEDKVARGPHAGRGGKHWGGHRGGHHGKKVLEAFRGEDFKASAAFPGGERPGHAGGAAMAGRMLDLAERVVPILSAEQRKIAADRLRASADAGELPFGR